MKDTYYIGLDVHKETIGLRLRPGWDPGANYSRGPDSSSRIYDIRRS